MTFLSRLPLPCGLLLALSGGMVTAPCFAQAPIPNYAHAPTVDRLLHWPRLPVRVFVATHGPDEEQNGRDALAGFDAWVRATGGVIRYVIVSSPGGANITVRFTPAATVSGAGDAVGVTDIRYAGTTLRHADMRLATGDTLRPVTPRDLNTLKLCYPRLFGASP